MRWHMLSVCLVSIAVVIHLQLTIAQNIQTKRGLTNLYNSRVVEARKVERPLWNNWAGRALDKIGINHQGVVVKTDRGQEYLVHKGPSYGKSSDTVVTDARHMSGNWRTTDRKQVSQSRVGDYVKSGGERYSLPCSNCQHAARRMYNQNNRR